MSSKRTPLIREGFFLRFYAILFTFLFVNSTYIRVHQYQSALSYFDIFLTTFGIIGMFCYVYKIPILSQGFWRVFPFLMLSWDVFMGWVQWSEIDDQEIRLQMLILMFAILPPYYMTLFFYGWRYDWEEAWKIREEKFEE